MQEVNLIVLWKIARKILDVYYGTDVKEKKVKEDTKAKAYTEKKRR